MSLSAIKSPIHQHLANRLFKKTARPAKDDNEKTTKTESDLTPLRVGTEVLNVPAAYKSIFRL